MSLAREEMRMKEGCLDWMEYIGRWVIYILYGSVL